MRRAMAVVVFCAAWGGMASSAAGAMVDPKFGETGELSAGGHRATIEVLAGCTDDGAVRFTVTLTQGDTVGVGHGAGVCTGELESYTVTVTARGGTFAVGGATACADAINREHGGGVDSRSWCGATPISLI